MFNQANNNDGIFSYAYRWFFKINRDERIEAVNVIVEMENRLNNMAQDLLNGIPPTNHLPFSAIDQIQTSNETPIDQLSSNGSQNIEEARDVNATRSLIHPVCELDASQWHLVDHE